MRLEKHTRVALDAIAVEQEGRERRARSAEEVVAFQRRAQALREAPRHLIVSYRDAHARPQHAPVPYQLVHDASNRVDGDGEADARRST